MTQLVTIFGGSGFVGRYIARRMAKEGWRVRVAVRNPNEAMHVKPYGSVGQVEPLLCNVNNDESVAAMVDGADAVVNCVGILDEHRSNTFDAIHSEAADRISRIAAEKCTPRLVHFSALGADIESESEYARTKAEGEAAVELNFPNAMILRPSIIFGAEDNFFNRFASMSRFGPVLPVVGAETKFQPVYVDDIAQAAVMGILGNAEGGVYELGGQDVDTFRGLMERMLDVVQRRRMIVNIPNPIANIIASLMSFGSAISLGILPRMITRDQIKSLETDNVVSEGAKSMETLGIKPTAMAAILPDYLWRFRTSGQYNAIKDSAKNLRNT